MANDRQNFNQPFEWIDENSYQLQVQEMTVKQLASAILSIYVLVSKNNSYLWIYTSLLFGSLVYQLKQIS